jgi:hypothetical protein
VGSGAAQALAALATTGHLDGDDFGRALVQYATRLDRQVLRNAVPALQYALSASPAAQPIATAILQWLPAVLPPSVPRPLPYTSHLLNLATDALAAAGPAPPATNAVNAPDAVTATATTTALNALAARPASASRSSRSAVSDAAQRLLAASTSSPNAYPRQS